MLTLLMWATMLVSFLAITIRFWRELPERRNGLLVSTFLYLFFVANAWLDLRWGNDRAPLNLGSVSFNTAIILLFLAVIFAGDVVSYVWNFKSYRTVRDFGWRTTLALIHLHVVVIIGVVCFRSYGSW